MLQPTEAAAVASQRAGTVHAGVAGRRHRSTDQVPVRRAEQTVRGRVTAGPLLRRF